MADFRDDSLLFSLKGLMAVEKERIEHADEARRREARIALAMRAERERLLREAEEKKRQALAEMLRLEEQRRREDEARLEALKQATLERARVEAEAEARLEIVERQQEHERKLLQIRSGRALSRSRGLTALIVAQSAIVLVGLGLYLGKLRPDARRLQVAYDRVVTAERSRAEEAKRQLERSERRQAELARELGDARKRMGELEGAPRPGPAPVHRPSRDTASNGPPASVPGSCKENGDPLDGCLR